MIKFKKPNFWKNINLVSLFFLPFSLITLLFNKFKPLIINQHKFEIPIICVGNIYVGGTGKTPLSIYIYNLLKKKKFKPAIVRKYYSSHLDEINLTKNKVKHFFSSNRRSLSILKAEQNKNSVVILDDGLQDLSIKKDLNIVCFNSVDLIGNGLLLPAGPLRNNLNVIKDCQFIIINGKKNITFEKKLKLISNNIKIYQSKYEIKKVKKYKGKKILAFAGIGNSENFFSLLKKNGMRIKDKISFPDHYQYTKKDIRDLILKAKEKKLNLITTEKDYFRIKHLGFNKIEYISINLKIIKNQSFENELLKSL